MICTELYNGQGLGNQLWNYALARVLAKKNACDFAIIGKEKFKGQEFMDIDFGKELHGGLSPEGGPALILPNGIKHYYREKTEYLKDTNVDISRTDEKLLALASSTKFDGNCQSTKYLEGYRQDLLEWIKIKEVYKKYSTDENTCIIHFRSGDFKKLKDVFLGADYYKHAMNQIRHLNPNVRFCCVTDEKAEAQKLLPDVEIIGSASLSETDSFKASHHKGGPVGIDFSLLLQARYLIIPNSSFSWWAGYLNTKKLAVIAPKYWARHNVSDGYWSTSDIITEGFTYIDRQGNAFSSGECWNEKRLYEEMHPDTFSPVPAKQSLLSRIKQCFI